MKEINRSDIGRYIGYEPKPTDWLIITQERINQFADCTLDHQFIHVNPEKAKDTPFASTIAHGFLTLSFLSHFDQQLGLLIKGTQMGLNYGFDKVRFLAPVKVNKRIRGKSRVLSIEESKPGQFRIVSEIRVEIEHEDQPALVAEWVTLQLVD